jgi:hypothetical protein
MQIKQTVPRFLSYGIIGIALFIIYQLYWYAPWALNPLAFLIRPALFLAVPLLIAAFAFALQRAPSGRSIVYAGVLLVIGISSLPLLHEWPALYTATAREDSYQALGALEAWYIWVALPFWFCCFMAIWPFLRRRQHDVRRHAS